MRLSLAAELAIRGVIVLADRYGKGPTTLSAVCGARRLPKQYLVKLFSSLAKADIVTPIRGKHGGYVLSRDPADITLLEVIEAVEGPIALNFCQHDPPRCDQHRCPLRSVWGELQGIVRRKLAGVAIASCVAGKRPGRRRRFHQAAPHP